VNIKPYLEKLKERVDKALDRLMPGKDLKPSKIHRAIRYSVFAGGKRLRPILCLMASEITGHSWQKVMPTACGLELIHTYSLIHDDLPCMDDDDFRRGVPTCHKAFDESTAVLAGDALLTLAFELIASNAEIKNVNSSSVVSALRLISRAAGTRGMVGGQVVDIMSEGKKISPAALHFMHMHKTGALITASLEAGAVVAGADKRHIGALRQYGEAVGLAFQLTDDILNLVGDAKKMGKSTGTDLSKKKATYPALYGIDKTREKVGKLIRRAQQELRIFKPEKSEPLRKLALYIQNRDK